MRRRLGHFHDALRQDTFHLPSYIGKALAAQKRKPKTGIEGMIGETGVAITGLYPNGKISIHGEIWKAKCQEGIVEVEEQVIVVRIDNLSLIVRKRSKED